MFYIGFFTNRYVLRSYMKLRYVGGYSLISKFGPFIRLLSQFVVCFTGEHVRVSLTPPRFGVAVSLPSPSGSHLSSCVAPQVCGTSPPSSPTSACSC